MNTFVRRGIAVGIALSLAGASPAIAQKRTAPALTLPAIGTFDGGGTFSGTISINRFERRGDNIVAMVFVSGVLSRSSGVLGTRVAGEIAWPVRVSSDGVSLVSNRALTGPKTIHDGRSFMLRPVGLTAGAQAATCPVLNVALGPNTVDLLGVQVVFSGAAIDLTGVTGTPLGDLVCEASKLVGNVAGLVGVLNNILALLTGLLGGLTGGLGAGAIPVQ